MKHLYYRLAHLPALPFILLWTTISAVYILLAGPLTDWIPLSPQEELVDDSPFWLGFIVAPLLETAMNQLLPYWVFLQLLGWWKRKWWIFFFSALFFGLFHVYSVEYIFYTFGAGYILILGYHIRRHRHPYWTLVVIHALVNGGIDLLQFLGWID